MTTIIIKHKENKNVSFIAFPEQQIDLIIAETIGSDDKIKQLKFFVKKLKETIHAFGIQNDDLHITIGDGPYRETVDKIKEKYSFECQKNLIEILNNIRRAFGYKKHRRHIKKSYVKTAIETS